MLHERFAAQAARTPDAPAILSRDGALSYRQLDEQANRLARHLIELGVGPEARVGIRMHRSARMVTSVLGVLKAGGAYVPLEPDWPAQRIDFVARDAGLSLVLDATELELDRHASTAPRSEVVADSLAYVIYTSGSTGTPKGTLITHRSACNHAAACISAFELTPADRVLQFASLAFDVSVEEIFPTLLAGASLVLRPNTLASVDALMAFVDEQRITVLNLPTAFWHLLVEERIPEVVRLIVVGGERASAAAWQKWRARSPKVRWLNAYGPTEATVTATIWDPERSTAAPDEPPIGKPIAGTSAYLLDPSGRPVPSGEIGELYLGGAGVARGYLDRPDLTAERFLPDPFSGEPGARMVRTGDLARLSNGGDLEFLGRADDQVKVRGYRIELTEIEAVLGTHPGVAQSAVVQQEDRLVAHWVGDASAGELVSFLAERLPGFMVPSAFVSATALPLTSSGKIDRRALEGHRAPREADSTPPRNEVEEALAGIWSEVFGLAPIGVHDDFIALGGHSLLAIRILSRVRQTFGVEPSIEDLFEVRTVAELARSVERARASIAPPLPRSSSDALSFAQERLWFLDRLAPDSASYNIPVAIRISGPLDAGALNASLEEIVRRHEVLRTTFEAGAHPVQRVAPAIPSVLSIVDLRASPGTVAARARAEAARPFDLRSGPLFRAVLFRCGGDEHLLVMVMHHIVSDGWSIDVLLRELSLLYEACAAGRPSPLPELENQYRDFAAWQRTALSSERLGELLGYWRRQLEGSPELLELPTDRPRPLVQSDAGGIHRWLLPAELSRAADAFCRREGATLFNTLLAAFALLLSRYSGSDDLVVGTAVANRNRTELEDLIGFFVNTLPLRIDLAGDPTGRELLQRVRSTGLGALAHMDLPFEKLVEAINPPRTPAHSPICQVMFVLHGAQETRRMPGLNVREEPLHTGTTNWDLMLIAEQTDEGLVAALEYRTDLFERSTVERMAGHYQELLHRLIEEPSRPTSRLSMLTPAESREITAWNQTARRYPEASIIQLFEAQAKKTPDAIALMFREEELTYRELDRRASRLAAKLAELGVEPEVTVGLFVERSVEMVVALLGILKAGGAWVPLDPEYPEERIAGMVRDAGAPLILCQRHLHQRAPKDSGLVVHIEELAGEELSSRPRSLDTLAYVLFTSGSTGRPKGVMCSHRGILNRLRWIQDQYPLTERDRVLQKTPFSFDVSIWELFWPLLFGATLVVAEPQRHRDPIYLRDLIASARVTIVHFVASLLRLFLEAEGLERCGSLERVITSGEELPREVRAAFHQRLPATELFNLYGPTEASIEVTHWRSEGSGEVIPIGKPVANTSIHLLDRWLNRVPIGVPGELYIGGVQVARGYVGRPDLTAERFIPDPYAGEPGARMYRSGDVARYLPDGNIHFLGRVDHQVKIRGFRIELGEIEAVLADHPAVKSSVVVAREDALGGKRLIAYLVAAEPIGTAGLRELLAERLPDYMVPSAFVFLDEMPLTTSGKIDRSALPAPDVGRPDLEAAFLEPTTPAEKMVAEIWSEVLGIEEVGIDDDFFALGGHSLIATRVVARIEESSGKEISLVEFFDDPTVRALARRVEEAEDLERFVRELSDEEVLRMLAERGG